MKEFAPVLLWGWAGLIFDGVAAGAIGIALQQFLPEGLPGWGAWLLAVAALLVASFRAYHDVRAKRDAYRDELAGIRNMEAKLLALTASRSQGVSLRNDGLVLQTPEQVPDWYGKFREWLEDAISAVRALSPVEAERFSRLDRFAPVNMIDRYLTEDHVRGLTQMTEWLSRLEDIIKRYAERTRK